MILKILVFLVIIYYLLKLVGQVFLPIFMTNRIQKMEEEKQKAYRDFINRKRKEEGKVTVDGKTKAKGHINPNEGEYIDFEEVK
jgi:hypothetical protein